MGRQNICFELLSLNARGLRSFDRRKSFFNWLFKSSADICFLQETYSTPEVENMWKKQWKGKMFFSHGTNHSRGVLILVKDRLDFKLQSVKVDSEGRYILLEVNWHGESSELTRLRGGTARTRDLNFHLNTFDIHK